MHTFGHLLKVHMKSQNENTVQYDNTAERIQYTTGGRVISVM